MDQEENAVERIQPSDRFADGIWVRMGGRREYMIPAITFRGLREMQGDIGALAQVGKQEGLPSSEQLSVIVKLAYMAMHRNYPDLTIEQVEDLVDMGNLMAVFAAVIKVSGLEPKKSGETGATS